MARPRDTLGLDGDDTVEVREALEDAFRIKMTDAEAAACETVGDVFSLIAEKVSPQEGACLTTMAFFRLRRALAEASGAKLRPASDLRPSTGGNAKAFMKRLSDQTGLTMPPVEIRWLGVLGLVMFFGGFVALFAGLDSQVWWRAAIGPALSAAGVGLARLDPGALTKDIRTLGGLARKVAVLNYGRLAADGGEVRATELRDAVTAILSEYVDVDPADIRPEMRLLAEPQRAA